MLAGEPSEVIDRTLDNLYTEFLDRIPSLNSVSMETAQESNPITTVLSALFKAYCHIASVKIFQLTISYERPTYLFIYIYCNLYSFVIKNATKWQIFTLTTKTRIPTCHAERARTCSGLDFLSVYFWAPMQESSLQRYSFTQSKERQHVTVVWLDVNLIWTDQRIMFQIVMNVMS